MEILIYIGSGIIFVWGLAHLFPTKKIVAGYSELTKDNRLVLIMEWLAEGVTLMFAGVLAGYLVYFYGLDNEAVISGVRWVAVLLIILAVMSFATLFRTSVIPNKMCGFIKTTVAVLLILGTTL